MLEKKMKGKLNGWQVNKLCDLQISQTFGSFALANELDDDVENE